MDQAKYSFIASSYVKYLEGSGARVVPIRYDLDEKSLIKIMSKINGLFLTGGAAELVTTVGINNKVDKIIDLESKSLDSNDKNITKVMKINIIVKNRICKKSRFFDIVGNETK